MSRINKTIKPGPKALEGLKIKKLSDGIYCDRTGIITNVVNQDSKSAQRMRVIIMWDSDELIGIDSNGKIVYELDSGISDIPAADLVNKEKYLVYSRY